MKTVMKSSHSNSSYELELTEISNSGEEETQPTLAIIGNGNYGRALAAKFHEAGLKFLIGSRRPNINKSSDVPIVSYEDAVSKSEIIFLAIPSHAYGTTVEPLTGLLAGKTIVDVSNLEKKDDPSNALRLQTMLPLSYVIKGLNTVSAYTLESDSYGASRDTFICGDNTEKKNLVTQILRDIGLNPVDKGGLRSALMIERLPFRFFPGWGTATTITFITLIPILLYTYLRFFWYQKKEVIEKEKHDFGLTIANQTIAWLMFWLLALTYLPGLIAGFVQLCRRTKYSRFPNWLDNWLKCRKQLGLISLFLASIHGCMSCLLMGAGEVKYGVKIQTIVQSNKPPVILYQQMDKFHQISFLFACLALSSMAVVGITSLPSVNSKMSWSEWDFIQRGIGFLCLVFGLIHVVVYMHVLWDPDYKFGWKLWKSHKDGIFPSAAFVMPMLPVLVVSLKLILMLPGISCYLNRIRKGKLGYRVEKIVLA